MRRMTRGLVAAMENEDLTNTPTATDENAVEVAEAGADLADDVVEIVDAVVEGDTDQAEVEEATDVAEALESIADAVGVAAQNGGLNQDAARAIGIAVQHMYDRVGLEAQAMPALESFGSSSQRISSTSLAMEDIKEQAGKIWAAIVAAVQKAIKWAQDFYNKIFGAAEKLSKRADALQTRAEGINGKAKEASFENEKLVKALHVGGKVSGVAQELGKLETLAKDVLSTTTITWTVALGEDLVKKMDAEGAEKSFVEGFELHSGGMIGKAVSNAEGAGFGEPVAGLTLYRSDELPGGLAIVGAGASSDLKGEAAVEAFRGTGQKVGPFDPKAKAPAEKKVTTLQTREMVEICKKVANLADAIRKYRDAAGKLNDVKKKFEGAASKLSKKVSGAEGEARDGLRAMAKVAGKFPSLVDQPGASFSAYVLNTGKAALDYVEASAKQYSAS
jgi:hypothetical protein